MGYSDELTGNSMSIVIRLFFPGHALKNLP